MKSASVTSQRSTTSLPTHISPESDKRLKSDSLTDFKPFTELAKEKSDPEKLASNGQLPSEIAKTQLPLEPCVFVSFSEGHLS